MGSRDMRHSGGLSTILNDYVANEKNHLDEQEYREERDLLSKVPTDRQTQTDIHEHDKRVGEKVADPRKKSTAHGTDQKSKDPKHSRDAFAQREQDR